MRKFLKNIFIVILMFVLTITTFIFFTLYKNYNLIKRIDNVKLSYVGSQGSYHINIKNDNNNYMIAFDNFKYYFDKKTYRIHKTELYDDTSIVMEGILWL